MAEKKRRVTMSFNADLHGTVLEPGPEVSGVRWDGDREVTYITNRFLVDEA